MELTQEECDELRERAEKNKDALYSMPIKAKQLLALFARLDATPTPDDLLRRVHERLGGLGVTVETSVDEETGDFEIEVSWKRYYGPRSFSALRIIEVPTFAAVPQAVLDYEDEQDKEKA